MEDAPENYNICPCCGTEFDNNDANTSISNLRTAWLKSGLKWWSPVDEPPCDWDPYQQLNWLVDRYGAFPVLPGGITALVGRAQTFSAQPAQTGTLQGDATLARQTESNLAA
jgi:hypothetical protein